jgi:hypothetical protein
MSQFSLEGAAGNEFVLFVGVDLNRRGSEIAGAAETTTRATTEPARGPAVLNDNSPAREQGLLRD